MLPLSMEPILAPEVQLIYEARLHRPKDEHDFQHVLPLLSADQRAWLKAALQRCFDSDPWVKDL